MALIGFLSLVCSYLLAGAALTALVRWKRPHLADVMTVGYIGLQAVYLLISLLWFGSRMPAYVIIGLAGAAIAWSLAFRESRGDFILAMRRCLSHEMVFFVLPLVTMGWIFLGTSPLVPWGTANGDLFDALRGAFGILQKPELVDGLRDILDGSMNYGQYTGSALTNTLSLHPPALLSDYWNLLVPYGLLVLNIAKLSSDHFDFTPFERWLLVIFLSVNCLLGVTILNGHVGSSMFLPLSFFMIRMAVGYMGMPRLELRFAAGLCAFFVIMLSYLYPVLLVFGPLGIIWLTYRFGISKGRGENIGFNTIVISILVVASLSMLLVYPHFESYRTAATLKYRAWAFSLRGEMLHIFWGIDPSGLCYSTKAIESPLSIVYQAILAGLISIITLIGLSVAWVRKVPGHQLLVAAIVCGLCLFIGIRFVIGDSYYTYKSLYISSPWVAICLLLGMRALSVSRVTRAANATLFLALIGLNCLSLLQNQKELTGAEFNRRSSDVGEIGRELQLLESKGHTPVVATTSYEYASIMESYSLRLGLKLFVNRWSFNEAYKESLRKAFTESKRKMVERNHRDREATSLIGESDYIATPRLMPELLRFDGMAPKEVWSNPVWAISDYGSVPKSDVFSYYSFVSKYPDALGGQPFRWIRDRLAFRVVRWPTTHRRLTFYAQAGYGSTSGLFDMVVQLNGHRLAHQVIGFPLGHWFNIEIPEGLIRGDDIFEILGAPVPGGPPLARREFINLRARVSWLRVAPLSANEWDEGTLAIYSVPKASLLGPETAVFGPGWNVPEFEGKRPLRWLTDETATIILAKPGIPVRGLRLAGSKGPACSEGTLVAVRSSAGWQRVVSVRDSEIFIPFDKDVQAQSTEYLTLTCSPLAPSASSTTIDHRRLVFKATSLELLPSDARPQ